VAMATATGAATGAVARVTATAGRGAMTGRAASATGVRVARATARRAGTTDRVRRQARRTRPRFRTPQRRPGVPRARTATGTVAPSDRPAGTTGRGVATGTATGAGEATVVRIGVPITRLGRRARPTCPRAKRPK
jgi:hypothetical protein